MENNKADNFIRECTRVFSFLLEDYAFDKPVAETKSDIHFTTVTYKKVNIALEVIFDEREQDITVKVVRLKNGVKPDNYAINDRGQICRASLITILMKMGVRKLRLQEELLKECMGIVTGQEERFYKKHLCYYAYLLKKHGKDILNDSPELFRHLGDEE